MYLENAISPDNSYAYSVFYQHLLYCPRSNIDAGAGVLRWMGWDDQQVFAYTWAARELIQPQLLDGSQATKAQPSAELIKFPSPKERTRNAST